MDGHIVLDRTIADGKRVHTDARGYVARALGAVGLMLLVLLGLAGLALAEPAFAQDEELDGEADNAIIVTGSRIQGDGSCGALGRSVGAGPKNTVRMKRSE